MDVADVNKMLPARPKVMVAGCFDLLHASHVVFLEKAAAFGDLYVSLGSDQSILNQKNRTPAFTQDERRYLLSQLKVVHWVGVVQDPGPLGFVEHLDQIKPDLFVINEDGDTTDKRDACHQRGIRYRVFPRDHFDPDHPTSTTQLSSGSYLPTRVSLCSGFMDNPLVNAHSTTGAGSLVVLPIEPIPDMQPRSGMASSTLATVRRYFGCRLPTNYAPDKLAEIIFCLENPPHRRTYISGTLDARGILGFGAGLFTYSANTHFPSAIQEHRDPATLEWLEEHIYLRHSWHRPADLHVQVLADHAEIGALADRMNEASLTCWDAILTGNFQSLCKAVDASHRAQCDLVRNHCPPALRGFIDGERKPAAMIMGAGGAGYVAFLSDTIPDDGIRVRIRRSDY